MNAHTNHQIVNGPDGNPMYVLVPYDEYVNEYEAASDEDVLIPHEVVKLNIGKGYSLIRAWREHLGYTQAEAAKMIGVSQPAFAQMEKPEGNPRVSTLKKIADAFGLQWEQLREG